MPISDPQRLVYEQWVDAHAPELFRFAYRLSGKRQVAEDLVQETFVEAWRSMGKQRHPERARAWLYQILRYRYSHFLRDNRHHARASTLAENHDMAAPANAPLDSMEQREVLQRALDTLAVDVRETFLMVFVQGAKCREVAETLHIPLGTVLSRIHRARALLREALQEPSAKPSTPPSPAADASAAADRRMSSMPDRGT